MQRFCEPLDAYHCFSLENLTAVRYILHPQYLMKKRLC